MGEQIGNQMEPQMVPQLQNQIINQQNQGLPQPNFPPKQNQTPVSNMSLNEIKEEMFEEKKQQNNFINSLNPNQNMNQNNQIEILNSQVNSVNQNTPSNQILAGLVKEEESDQITDSYNQKDDSLKNTLLIKNDMENFLSSHPEYCKQLNSNKTPNISYLYIP